MSNVITFLESLGREPALAARPADDYAAAVAALDVGDDARAALLARDAAALNGLLGGRLRMMAILFPADGDEKKDGEQKDDGDGPSEDEQKDSVGTGF